MKGVRSGTKFEGSKKRGKAIDAFQFDQMKQILSRNEDDRKEIQNLNDKFQSYLSRVRQLDEQNRLLNEKISGLKSQWGFEDETEDRGQYSSELDELRVKLDTIAKEKIELELKVKRAEYDIFSYEKGLNFLESGNKAEQDKILELQAMRDTVEAEIENLENQLVELQSGDGKNSDELFELMGKLEELKDEYDKESLARVRMQNELQTLEEKIGFTKAIYEEELNDMKNITSIHIDAAGFYKRELTRAIAAIREDFDKLRAAHKDELDGYYKAKIEEVSKYAEDRKKRIQDGADNQKPEDLDLSELRSALIKLQKQREDVMREHSNYESEYQSWLTKLEEIRERFAEADATQMTELQQLRAHTTEIENAILCLVEGNVSLKFEINTYRRLLQMEESRLASPDKWITTTANSRKEQKRRSRGFFNLF